MEITPSWADIVFPVLSFGLTLVAPAAVGVWVMVRTIKDWPAPVSAAAKAKTAKR